MFSIYFILMQVDHFDLLILNLVRKLKKCGHTWFKGWTGIMAGSVE